MDCRLLKTTTQPPGFTAVNRETRRINVPPTSDPSATPSRLAAKEIAGLENASQLQDTRDSDSDKPRHRVEESIENDAEVGSKRKRFDRILSRGMHLDTMNGDDDGHKSPKRYKLQTTQDSAIDLTSLKLSHAS